MATQAQITANRINAQASTGPSSPAGIAVAKYNATRHGLSGSQVVVKGEDPAAFDALRARLIAEYAPASEREAMLVEEIAQNWWRLQRARRTEAHLINHYGMVHCLTDPDDSRTFKNVTRYLNGIERSWRRACLELENLQQLRGAQPDPKPAAAAKPASSPSSQRLRFVERPQTSEQTPEPTSNPDPNVLISTPPLC